MTKKWIGLFFLLSTSTAVAGSLDSHRLDGSYTLQKQTGSEICPNPIAIHSRDKEDGSPVEVSVPNKLISDISKHDGEVSWKNDSKVLFYDLKTNEADCGALCLLSKVAVSDAYARVKDSDRSTENSISNYSHEVDEAQTGTVWKTISKADDRTLEFKLRVRNSGNESNMDCIYRRTGS